MQIKGEIEPSSEKCHIKVTSSNIRCTTVGDVLHIETANGKLEKLLATSSEWGPVTVTLTLTLENDDS